MQPKAFIFIAPLVFVGTLPSLAAFQYSSPGGTYSQNFDSLAATGTDHDWVNDSTIRGWSLFRVTSATNPTPMPLTLYDASSGSDDSGRFYSFGTGADRALGGIGNANFGYPGDQATSVLVGASAGWIALSITNATGLALDKFTLRYDGEQWRDAGDNEPPYAQTMEFQYGFGNTFATVAA